LSIGTALGIARDSAAVSLESWTSSPGNLGFLVCNGDASGGAAWKRRRAVQRREGAGEALPILPARVRRV